MSKLNVPVEMLEAYKKFIKDDYIKWSQPVTEIRQEMIDRFVVDSEVGSSYIKIVRNGSVHSFIVNKAGKFPVGTILKAAGWRAPAKNFARGDLLKPETWAGRIQWTGAA